MIHNIGNKLFLVTDYNTPNKKVVTVNYNDLDVSKWNDFIPETEFVLNISKAGGYFFARYMIDAISKVYQLDYKGKLIREIELPGIGTASGFNAKKTIKNFTFHLVIITLRQLFIN